MTPKAPLEVTGRRPVRTTPDLGAPLSALAAKLSDEIPEMVERGLARMRDEAPDYFVRDNDPDFVELYRQSYLSQLRFIYEGLASRRDLAASEPPAFAVEEARAAASFGIKLNPLLHTYRIGQRMIFEDVITTAQEQIPDDDLRSATLSYVSRWLFAYVDWLSERITEAFERERDLLVQDREQRKRHLISRVLGGEPVDGGGELGYDLERDHLAVVAWGQEPSRALSALGAATGISLVTTTNSDGSAWAWLGARELGDQELRAVRKFEPPEGTSLAFGDPASGPDGFRLSHAQAVIACRLACGDERITWHSDVAVLALALQDPALARQFVRRELGPLAETDERSARLRETLSVYFRSGHNGASAAAALGIHDRTVLYRIRSIEKRLGYSISERREELGIALRLAPLVLDEAATTQGPSVGPSAADD